MKSLDKGFSLVEVLIAAAILAFCLCGLLAIYINLLFLSDLARDLTSVTNLVQEKMEEMKKREFGTISSFEEAFDENLVLESESGYDSQNKKGILIGEVSDTTYTDLKRVRINAYFKSQNRVIGEDKNLNGDLDSGEDTLISNNRLDSPVDLVGLIVSYE